MTRWCWRVEGNINGGDAVVVSEGDDEQILARDDDRELGVLE